MTLFSLIPIPQTVYLEAEGEEEGAKIDTDRLSGKGTLKTNNFAKALGFEACRLHVLNFQVSAKVKYTCYHDKCI